jgi:hypothetical protein
MELANHKVYSQFLEDSEKADVISFVDGINRKIELRDHHLKHLVSKINGASYMYDIGKTAITREITAFQSGGHVMEEGLPPVFYRLVKRICSTLGISSENSFLQVVDMNNGGSIGKHYDAAFPGHINYKCNISVLSEDYDFVVDDQTIHVKELDMYCFEASLYKHWTPNSFTSRRILLSFGFMLPYADLGRSAEDPRVRLSNRIQKRFQN